MNLLKALLRDESGQGLAEYTVLISLITLGLMLVLRPLREAIVGVLQRVAEVLAQAIAE